MFHCKFLNYGKIILWKHFYSHFYNAGKNKYHAPILNINIVNLERQISNYENIIIKGIQLNYIKDFFFYVKH